MPTTINGTTGVSQVQDNTITSQKIGDGSISGADLVGNQGGTAPIYGVRAWCLFNGSLTDTNPPIASGNVSNITRNGVGDYTLNFTTALPDTDYGVVFGSVSSAPATLYVQGLAVHTTSGTTPTLKTTSQLRIINYVGNSNSDVPVDSSQISVMIVR